MSKIRLHGSSSGYTEIAPVAASGNNTLTLPNGGTIISKDSNGAVGVTSVVTTTATITTAKIGAGVTITESGIEASGIGITVANINGGQIGGRRNIIINGAMMIAERGTSSTSNDNGLNTLDRFRATFSGTDETPTQEQADVSSGDTGPYQEGFRKAFKITNGNQTSGAGADDYVRIGYGIEAQDIANSGWNYTSSSSFITLSFWVNSSVSQSFKVELYVDDGTAQAFSFDTGTLSAGTWTKIIKTIPGNSNLTFDDNTGEGLYIRWLPFFGTSFTSSSVTEDAWAAYSGSARTKDNTTTWYTTNDATFELTGVQLEVGSQVTPFEHRSKGEELSLCQRYYYKHVDGNTQDIAGGMYYTANLCAFSVKFPVSMRAAPTLDYASSSDAYTIYSNGQSDPFTSMNIVRAHVNSAAQDTSTGTSGTQGHGTSVATASASGYIAYSSEIS